MYPTSDINADGTLHFWDVHRQQWIDIAPGDVSDQQLATCQAEERWAIEAMAKDPSVTMQRCCNCGRYVYAFGTAATMPERCCRCDSRCWTIEHVPEPTREQMRAAFGHYTDAPEDVRHG
jgi:hypothetical protein